MANGKKRRQIHCMGKDTCTNISTVTDAFVTKIKKVYSTCILSLIALVFLVFRSLFVSKMASRVVKSF